MPLPSNPFATTRARRDLAAVLAFTAGVYVIGMWIDLHERIMHLLPSDDRWELDELFLAFTALAIGLCWYVWRRMARQRESEQRYRSLFERESDAVMIFDAETLRFEEANAATLKLFGYTAQEFRRLTVRDISTERAETESSVAEHKAGRLTHVPMCQYRRKDGSEFFGEIFASDFTAARGRRKLVGVVRDITAHVETEKALRELNASLEQRVAERTAALSASEGQLRIALASLGEGVIEVDAKGRVVLMNSEAERLLRWSAEEANGKPIGELMRPLHADGSAIEPDATAIARASQQGEVVRQQERWVRRTDGSRFLTALVASPIVGAGKVTGAMLAFQDISGQKETEHLRDELITRVGHELRTPLAGIHGAVELLRARADLPEDARQQLLGILAADTARLTALVEEFTDLRRRLTGQHPFRPEPLAVETLLEEAAARATVDEARERLRIEVPPDLPLINADRDGIAKVLDHLLSNAFSFSPKGTDIRLEAHAAEGELRVAVTDQGMGIPPEAKGKLFTPFFQVETTDTRRHAGAGLGLVLVKAIVEAHGGHVGVESEAGKGASFWFSLPMERRRGGDRRQEAGVRRQQPKYGKANRRAAATKGDASPRVPDAPKAVPSA